MKTTHSIVLAALACAAVSQPALVAQKVGKHPPPTPRDTPVATPPQTSGAPNANAPSSGATYLYDQKPAPPPAPIVPTVTVV